MKKTIPTIKDMDFFTSRLWSELKRFDANGERVRTVARRFSGMKGGELLTVTCTEENIQNLYNSQFADKTVYGQIYLYE
jgi:hypothetical protein